MFRSKMTFALTMNWCAEIAKAVIRSRRSIGQNGLRADLSCELHQGPLRAVSVSGQLRRLWRMLRCTHFDKKGGLRTFDAVSTDERCAGQSRR